MKQKAWKWGSGEGFNRYSVSGNLTEFKYLMLFIGTVGPHVICAQKTHLKVVVEVLFLSDSSCEFDKA